MNSINPNAVDRGLKYSSALGTLSVAILFSLSAAASPPPAVETPAGVAPRTKTHKISSTGIDRSSDANITGNPGDAYQFAAIPPTDRDEPEESRDNRTIDAGDRRQDTGKPSAGPAGKSLMVGTPPEAGKKAVDVAPQPAKEPVPDQNAVKPASTGKNSASPNPAGAGAATGTPAVGATPAPDTTAPQTGSPRIIGGTFVYVVKKRESLRMVGAKTGTDWRLLAKENHLDPAKRLEPGQKIVVNNRKIVPKFVENGIVINIPDRTLYFFRDNRLAKALPVAVGRRQHDRKTDWRTPTGKFRIVAKQKNPAWHIPPSIIKEMEKSGKTVKSDIVPPGGRNPLGKYAMRTSISGVMIHSTTRPESVYGFSSHGCIRMLPGNIEELYKEVQTRTTGEIIYQPVKMAVTADGRVFLEVHPDSYDRHKNLESEVKRLVAANDAKSSVDWNKIRASLKLKSGQAEDVTLEKDVRGTLQAASQAKLPTP